ncbi:MAG: type II toxin-antitoxin system RelE/ParE family toxin [Methanoregula sp.]|nr:type II toxin-antitoxin system RelE/ParE family toxin [Methanoregula sp.]
MYAIHLSRRAQKDLLDLPVKEARRIRGALNELGSEPEPQTLVKKLKGHEHVPLYSYRVGRYRAILTIDHGMLVIFVITIEHRSSVYRNM